MPKELFLEILKAGLLPREEYIQKLIEIENKLLSKQNFEMAKFVKDFIIEHVSVKYNNSHKVVTYKIKSEAWKG